MPDLGQSALWTLLESVAGTRRTEDLFGILEVPESLAERAEGRVSRSVLAMAMDMLLFEDVLHRVPTAEGYVRDKVRAGRRVVYDHGALRTVKAPSGTLPEGQLAFARLLEPLGYAVNGTYPLDRLSMTGYAYAHQDLPEALPQFFVSELHPELFSEAFQASAARVLSTSRDPLSSWASPILEELRERKELPLTLAARLLPNLVACFDRQHEAPRISDYEILLAESAEMAWIATEGNAFNHATDRVPDVVELSEEQKRLGRPMKDEVEFSESGRVVQTALHAAEVERTFAGPDGHLVLRTVPGSFFEFITRKRESDGKLDLRFDSSNAQGIFKMTSAGWC